MIESWNDSHILPPPIHTCPYDNIRDVRNLKQECDNIITILTKQSPLHKESAILSRFVYKYDKKFRHDIGYRNFRKVNTALHKYLALNFLKDVEYLMAGLPSDEDIYLPSRQMLEYVLIRLQAFSKIMIRICVCAKQAAMFYLNRIKRGESHWMSLMPYAVLCRIHSICLVLLHHSCKWYTNLYTFLDKLQLKGVQFISPNYKLPDNLDEWLDMKNLDSFGRFNWLQRNTQDIDTTLIEDNENDTINAIFQFVDKVNEDFNLENDNDTNIVLNKFKMDTICEIAPVLDNKNIDQGEVVSRETFNTLNAAINQNVKSYHHNADNVTNKHALKTFLVQEEIYRNENNIQSLTSHLTFMQWQALKKSLELLLESLASNRKIQHKFKKIWKEKCLES